MKQNERLLCVNELQPGDRVVNVYGLVDGVGTVSCQGCTLARARVRVSDVTQVNFGTLKRKVNEATIVAVEEVYGGCVKRVHVC